jgi:hypothetical protein
MGMSINKTCETCKHVVKVIFQNCGHTRQDDPATQIDIRCQDGAERFLACDYLDDKPCYGIDDDGPVCDKGLELGIEEQVGVHGKDGAAGCWCHCV